MEPPGNENFTGFQRIPQHLIFPVMWIEQKVIPPSHVQNEIWLLKSLRKVVNGAGIFFILLAISFMVILFFSCLQQIHWHLEKKSSNVKSKIKLFLRVFLFN